MSTTRVSVGEEHAPVGSEKSQSDLESITTDPAPIPVAIQDDGFSFSNGLNIAMFVATLLSLGVAAYATWQNAKTAQEASESAQDATDQMEEIATASRQTMWTAKDQLDRLEIMMSTGTQIMFGLDDVAREFSRPRMNAYLGSPTDEKGYLPLIIENVGKSPAGDVTVEFDPPLPEPDVTRLNANTSETIHYRKSLVEMTLAKYDGKTFKTWAPNQSTSVPFWATKFERFPKEEIVKSKHFVNPDGTPADAVLVRVETDGAMLLDESGDGIPADIEVVINYRDEHGNKFSDRVSLNPDLWVSTTFRSTEQDSTTVIYGGDS